MAALDVLLSEAGVHYPIKPANVVAEMFEDAADDAIAAAVDLEADLGPVFRIGISDDVDVGGAVFEDYPAADDLVEVTFRENLVEDDVVDLLYFVGGVGEFLREIAIVGEEEDTGGVAIQATDGEDAFGGGVLDEMQDGFTALRSSVVVM